jgi:hypothetical protein
MMNFFIFLALSLFSMSSHALVELRVGYGLMASKPDLAPVYSTSTDLPAATPAVGLSTEVLVQIPLVGIGGGVRNENLGITYDASGIGIENKINRSSVVLSYRLIDTLLYLGPILTYGVSHSGSLKVSALGNTVVDLKPDSISSYSVGLEAGAKLIGFLVGAEVGYMDMRYKNAVDQTNTANHADLNMSGSYMRVVAGFGF